MLIDWGAEISLHWFHLRRATGNSVCAIQTKHVCILIVTVRSTFSAMSMRLNFDHISLDVFMKKNPENHRLSIKKNEISVINESVSLVRFLVGKGLGFHFYC